MKMDDGPHIPTIIVGQNGDILEEFDNLQYIYERSGTGPGGNAKVGGRYQYGRDFDKLWVDKSGSTCVFDTTNVKVVNLNHRESGSSAFAFTCPENTFKTINGAYSPLNDASHFGNVVFEMYKDWYGVDPLPFQLTLRVHYSNNYENAFWDGSSMTFGDGASYFHPLVGLDIVAHEVSHGVTEFRSNLVYDKQSGGINEAFSDMAGKAAEYYVKESVDHPKWNWKIGYDIVKGSGSLRHMDFPPLDGVSIDDVSQYYDGMDVHYSSGVYNKAYHLISTSPGFTPKIAFDIFYLANSFYWGRTTTFAEGATGVMSAALDLRDDASDTDYTFNIAKIADAFLSVGICCRPALDCETEWTGSCVYDLTPCDPNPCVNGGMCNDLGSGRYQCTCPNEYAGVDCQLQNPCVPENPCDGGGTCNPQDDGSFKCVCPNGRIGMLCEIFGNCYASGTVGSRIGPDSGDLTVSDISISGGETIEDIDVTLNLQHTWVADLTIDLTAVSHGTQVTLISNKGGSGDNFQETILDDEATETLPLSSGAAPFSGRYKPEGLLSNFDNLASAGIWRLQIVDNANYDGGTLENWMICIRTSAPVDACLSSPCKNSGSCNQDGVGGYTCSCLSGYTGVDCQVANPCILSSPCQNSGTCNHDGTHEQYSCSCDSGYSGTDCEIGNPCALNPPCLNDGTCTHDGTDGEFSCNCLTGYSGNVCEISNPCVLNPPCQNSGSCNHDGTDGGYTCSCQQGYTGSNCQIANPCLITSPCQNGGTCSHDGSGGDYSCTCETGYSGTDCEIANPCILTLPCQNGGTCGHDGSYGDYTCSCRSGYSGTDCEIIADPCQLNSHCPNGATCVHDDINDSYTCTCSSGNTAKGENPCDPISPCQNGAMCNHDGNGEYTCSCIEGYSGNDCQIENPCVLNPQCQNGAPCNHDGSGGYSCSCSAGYSGNDCEIANPCVLTSPCQNGATCNHDDTGGYTCSCIHGYSGSDCEISNPCVLNAPCQNGGTCAPDGTDGGYTCSCDSGYGGDNCETITVQCSFNYQGRYIPSAPTTFNNISPNTLERCRDICCENNCVAFAYRRSREICLISQSTEKYRSRSTRYYLYYARDDIAV